MTRKTIEIDVPGWLDIVDIKKPIRRMVFLCGSEPPCKDRDELYKNSGSVYLWQPGIGTTINTKDTKMKQTIEVDIPEGFEVDIIDHVICFKKKPPRRRVFECVSEEPREAEEGEWIEYRDGDLMRANANDYRKHKIFKEVTE